MTSVIKADVYQEVTDRIIAELEQGATPWVKQWDNANPCASIPINALGNPYNGINVLLLWVSAYKNGFSSSQWMTYKQAKDKGANVMKGQKGTRIVFFKQITIDRDTDDERNIPLAKSYTVFNASQIEGLPASENPVTDRDHDRESHLIGVAQAAGVDLQVIGDQACYIPSQDVVRMPALDQFHSVDAYDSTLAHELTHWTGAKSRLDRDLSGRFGDDQYAAEELIAELGAAFVCAEYGIAHENLRHAGYIDHWLRVLKGDKKAIFTASSKAQQALNYIKEQAISTETRAAA